MTFPHLVAHLRGGGGEGGRGGGMGGPVEVYGDWVVVAHLLGFCSSRVVVVMFKGGYVWRRGRQK